MNRQFIKNNIIRFSRNSDRFIGKRLVPWIDEIYSFIRFGCSPDDYFRYEFYRKSSFERDKFITYRRSQKIIHEFNKREYVDIFSDKRKFNNKFDNYIKREWIDLGRCTKGEFESFLKKHNSLLIKPLDGGQGKGIFKIKNDSDFNLASNPNCIAEEILIQHEKMRELNPTSVNTVRVLTFKGKIIACALRIGGDNAIVDNLHSNGVCAHLDKDSGIIDALCIDNNLNKYLKHPKTGKVLVGFQVPNWEILISRVLEAAKVVPEVQYVGWDVAVLENDVAIIEGNHDPGHDVVQMIAQTGLWEDIKRLMR